ncbi:MAG: hypothetical protein V5A28_03510 [Haloarculaceae archaeon]
MPPLDGPLGVFESSRPRTSTSRFTYIFLQAGQLKEISPGRAAFGVDDREGFVEDEPECLAVDANRDADANGTGRNDSLLVGAQAFEDRADGVEVGAVAVDLDVVVVVEDDDIGVGDYGGARRGAADLLADGIDPPDARRGGVPAGVAGVTALGVVVVTDRDGRLYGARTPRTEPAQFGRDRLQEANDAIGE